MTEQQFGDRLRHLRTSKGMSTTRISAEAGIDSGLYARLETNQRQPTDEALQKLAPVLGVPFERLKAWSVLDRLSTQARDFVFEEELERSRARLKELKEEGHARDLARQILHHRAENPLPTFNLPVFSFTARSEPNWVIALAEEWQPWPEPVIGGAESVFRVLDDSLADSGFLRGDLLLVRLPEDDEEPVGKRVVVNINGTFACKRYRSDALGPYLEGLTAKDEPWRLPVTEGVEVYAVIEGAFSSN